MSTFFVFEKRDFQSRLSNSNFLKLVEIFGLLRDTRVRDRIGQCEETASGSYLLGLSSGRKSLAAYYLFRNRLAEFVHVNARKIELADFLLQRHASHQIAHSSLNGLLRIEVERNFSS